MLNNNLIIIYGREGSFKSSIAAALVNGLDELTCYINLEGNRHLEFNTKVKVFNDDNIIDREFIKECISDYNIVLIDSMESLNYTQDDLIYLKELAKDNVCTLIVVANSENVDEFKSIADLMIHSKRH